VKRKQQIVAGVVIIVVAAFMGGYLVGSGDAAESDDAVVMFKELVIDYIKSEKLVLEKTRLVFDTIDQRKAMVAATGMLRTSGSGEVRVGRFWVELYLKGGKWVPETVQIFTTSDSNSDAIRWP
jgi:hypothetical protein